MNLDDATQDRFAATAERLAALGEKRIESLRSRIVDLVDPLGHEFALDAATGTGPFALALAPLVREVLAIDSVPEMLDEGRRLAGNASNVRFVEGSVYELPVGDGEIDLATFGRTLHHLDRPAEALAELARVLTPGGRLVVIDQLVSEDAREARLYERMEHMRDPSHVSTLSDSSVRALVQAAGLRMIHAATEPEQRDLGVFLELAGCTDFQRAEIFDYARGVIESGESAGVDMRTHGDGVRFTGCLGVYVAER
jgi:ubiquinone/menaquinone biosynthesis C-methylase UbiE